MEAWALYLFLVTVGDAQGLSYYSDASVTARVPLDRHELLRARHALIDAGLIAFEPPLYQVLSLDLDAPATPAPRRSSAPLRLSEVLQQLRKTDMIDYATYQRIQHLHRVEQLTVTQIAHAMALDARTVRRWLDEPRFRPRVPCARPSKLDPFKGYIRRLLEHHPYSAAQILNRLREAGYDGGATLVKDYLQRVRPVRAPAFLTLHFAPGECAQVDWGHYGSVNIGNTRRRLSFFVMVLCYSRMLYVEFTVSQTMEHFLGCHLNAFEFFAARVPARIMIDNLKSAVLQRSIGQAPVFNPRYADFARHHRFDIAPCNVGAGHEKGRVEAGVGYVKKNFLAGLDIPDFRALNPAARHWLDTVANVRTHGETHQRPLDLFALEREPVATPSPSSSTTSAPCTPCALRIASASPSTPIATPCPPSTPHSA